MVDSTLREEIIDTFEELKTMDKGSDEYKKTVECVSMLIDRANDMDKIENDFQDKVEARIDQKKDRWITNGITLIGILSSVGLTVWGTRKTFKFDSEGGLISSSLGRGWLNKIIPKK